MSVGKRIREARDRIGMSQVDFASAIGVTKQTLYKYENDLITNIPSDKIELAAKISNVTPGYLMGWEEGVENSEHLPHYIDDETASIAESIATNPELKQLYAAQRDLDPDDIKALYSMTLALKRKSERLDSDDPA